MSERFGRGVSAENVQMLVDEKLRPLGVLAQADGSSPQLEKVDPMLALKFRAALVPERVVNAITTVFRPLFLPPVVVAVLAGLVALDVWLFFMHGVAQSARSVLYQPVNLLILLGLVALSAAFHECGHATACRYGGAKPGVMGAGLYIVWPAFYTDVTDAYRLGKGGRLRTDLGGVYFNVIFILATAGAYALTGFEPLLLVIPLQHIEIIHQFLPFLRLDGYYIVSDLTGVPDMFARIKPTLASIFLPWRETPEEVTVLKPWVRVATTWDSAVVQYHSIGGAGVLGALYHGFEMVILLLLGLVILSAAFHETGHATACRYGGARPGKMGVGLYIVWPAFYTDVTDAYRLGKGGRLRTDLGGVYFNVIFILATVGAYLLTGFEPLLLMIPLQHLEILHQFLPFLRLDGYYIVSDLTGVPDMFSRIKPALTSLLPWREADERVTEL
ncbi:MAG: putative peptide zinc metalloprotease protein, partial [Gaiellaceae bacterium]|nr:putative peptide zinc metalloprotease protein [Gaiellaceae bacterium]